MTTFGFRGREEHTLLLLLPEANSYDAYDTYMIHMIHMVDTNVLNKAQYGFVKGLSTTTNLLESFNDWTISIQALKSITVAYIDFAKAFDTVSHPKLLHRLRQYGMMEVSWTG